MMVQLHSGPAIYEVHLVDLRSLLVHTRRDGAKYLATYPKVAAQHRNVFQTYEPIPDGSNMPDYWATAFSFRFHGEVLVSEALLDARLTARWCAEKWQNVETRSDGHPPHRRRRVIRRFPQLQLWFESEEDVILLKLIGLPI